MKLEGKVAVVTGGGEGIGRGICLALAREGADVAVNDIRSKKGAATVAEIEKLGRRALAVKADVSNKEDVHKMVNSILEKFRQIDILVNNAGVAPYCPFLELDEETWDRTININLKGVFLCSQRVAQEMIARKTKGKIINISSLGGQLAQRGLAHYNASKGGLNNMTKTMALELSPQGIHVNTIAPGAVEVDRNRASLVEGDYRKQWETIIPIGRWGQPEDIGKIVVFLAGDGAEYINGQVICADGGQSAQVPQPDYDYRKFEATNNARP